MGAPALWEPETVKAPGGMCTGLPEQEGVPGTGPVLVGVSGASGRFYYSALF